MNIQEFSDGFTTLLNSYLIKPEFGEQDSVYKVTCNEYEKSLFLTLTQEEIVEALYKGTLMGVSFEKTEEMRRKLDALVKTTLLTSVDEAFTQIGDSIFFALPVDMMFITLEQIVYGNDLSECLKGKRIAVKPVTQDEYNRIKDNPFRGVTDNRALRLDYGKVTSNRYVEILTKYPDGAKYYLKYLAKPEPIILEDLTDTGLYINGEQSAQTCKLDTTLHKLILERAVLMALRVKGINTESK